MSTQTIVAHQVYPPNTGKKFGRVLTPDKTAYMGTASILSGIQPKTTIVVDLEEQTWGDKKVQVIQRVIQAAPNTPAPVGAQSASEDIFVTGVVGRAMGSGKFAVTDIKLLTLAAAEAYREWKGKPNEIRSVQPSSQRPLSNPSPVSKPANAGDDLRYAEQF